MAVSLVPEHLRKPELIFEVTSRGQEPEKEVKGLRGQLRNCINAERSWQESFVLEQEKSACETRMEELEDDIEGGSLPMTGTARARLGSQLIHWHDRLMLLVSAPGVTISDKEWAFAAASKLKRALDALNDVKSVKQKGAAFQGTLNLAPTTPNIENLQSPTLRQVDVPPVYPDVSTVINPPGLPVVLGQGPQNSTSVGELSARPFSAFSKLPHPLSAALQNIPRVDGLDVNALLAFFAQIFRVREFPGMTDSMLMKD